MTNLSPTETDSLAQLVLPSQNLTADIDFFTNIGFRLDQIFPADDPAVAILSGHQLHIRLDRSLHTSPASIHLLIDDPKVFGIEKEQLQAPNGSVVIIQPKTYQLKQPVTQHKFEVRKLQNNDSWIIGRAGMLYRDLIPDRLGGSIIASHIHIPEGGPVPDMVHYHTIGFQLIFCYRGWVRLVYEDQGEPFTLSAGDCVTQPPEIRHRVLEASDNLEVIEIGVPAMHMTTIDHEMELPNANYRPERLFQGQRFCHHKEVEASWQNWHHAAFQYRDTGINEATQGVASVHVIKSSNSGAQNNPMSHNADILFSFVMEGSLSLITEDQRTEKLGVGDAFVIPPGMRYQLHSASDDLEVLEVSLPGTYQVRTHE